MITSEIREAYPSITKSDLDQLTPEEFNKLSIKFHEDCVREYKTMLGELFKDKSVDYPEWYKELLRDNKTRHEKELKSVVFAQGYLRDGLNPPLAYQKNEGNPYGFVREMNDDKLLKILAPLGTEIPDPTGVYADLFAYLYDKISPLIKK